MILLFYHLWVDVFLYEILTPLVNKFDTVGNLEEQAR